MSADDDPSERLIFSSASTAIATSCLGVLARMRQTALVLAFARAPRPLLLDEPSGPLDPDASGC
ncbi:MAG: hypothetical protein ACLT98_14190 [Eggerthellaceae bacterium]